MCRFVRIALVLLCLTAAVQAHVVPSVTMESEFARDGGYTLRINLDPRVFLSDRPTTLPPVSAEWFLGQTDLQKQATFEKAEAYLKANFSLLFSGRQMALPAGEFVPLDGATSEPLTPETAETHLLYTAHGQRPPEADKAQIVFGRNANVSLILFSSEEGREEKQTQAVFAGETSPPFKLTVIATPMPPDKKEIQVTETKVTRVYPDAPKVFAFVGGGILILFILGLLLMRRSKRR